jgi:N-acetylmuramoyl-L-alanine amidase
VDLSYRPGEIDGKIGYATRGAIIAFQKWEGLPRNGKLTDEVLARLQTAGRPTPSKQGGTDPWIEVNKAKQVLLYCKNGAVEWTIPVSTGSSSVGFATPSRTYKILRKTQETNPRWHPLYISPRGRYLAIHGYPSVPTRAASHGCVRTQIWDQRELFPLIPVGTQVYIY